MGVVVNIVLLWVVHQLLDWDWPGFLTQDFEELLPLITFSLVVSIVGYLLLLAWATSRWLKRLIDVISAAIGAVVLAQMLQVYPFDFTGYDRNWSWLVRLALIVGLVGSIIGLVVGSIRLLTSSTEARAR